MTTKTQVYDRLTIDFGKRFADDAIGHLARAEAAHETTWDDAVDRVHELLDPSVGGTDVFESGVLAANAAELVGEVVGVALKQPQNLATVASDFVNLKGHLWRRDRDLRDDLAASRALEAIYDWAHDTGSDFGALRGLLRPLQKLRDPQDFFEAVTTLREEATAHGHDPEQLLAVAMREIDSLTLLSQRAQEYGMSILRLSDVLEALRQRGQASITPDSPSYALNIVDDCFRLASSTGQPLEDVLYVVLHPPALPVGPYGNPDYYVTDHVAYHISWAKSLGLPLRSDEIVFWATRTALETARVPGDGGVGAYRELSHLLYLSQTLPAGTALGLEGVFQFYRAAVIDYFASNDDPANERVEAYAHQSALRATRRMLGLPEFL